MDNNYVIDVNPYDLGKDIDGRHHDVREIHPILIKIILEFDRICRKYNIPYALSFGSALGIYNYGGFIPWDDDMDIVLPKDDFKKLIAILRHLESDKYILHDRFSDFNYILLLS